MVHHSAITHWYHWSATVRLKQWECALAACVALSCTTWTKPCCMIVKNKYCIFQYANNKLPPSGTGSTKKRKDGMNKQWQASSSCASAHVRNKPWLGWKTTLRLEATSSSLKLVSTICKAGIVIPISQGTFSWWSPGYPNISPLSNCIPSVGL